MSAYVMTCPTPLVRLAAVNSHVCHSVLTCPNTSAIWRVVLRHLEGIAVKLGLDFHGRRYGSDSGWPVVFSQFQFTLSARMEEHGFEITQIADVLKARGKDADGYWLWCTTDDSVYDAVKSMTRHKHGEKNSNA
ncbi:hypothetical protein LWI28_005725 [Acer negundo]|uniref:Uncharacterized protein n=1 Tax=Acer negundo TaxID=4023 RepID=A0AAD5JPE3_ACENE|nr:hypothetical protein LWI28_005725 [Acer negundo]